jgi:hypothetical protein
LRNHLPQMRIWGNRRFPLALSVSALPPAS